jgi:dTDP-4-amino-4,6-dideoxygalactose transaminase
MRIPLSRPIIGDEETAAVETVLRSGMLAAGETVTAFESAFAAYCGVAHAVAVGSGTAALHLGLLAAGVGKGDEVIVPSFTFAATANAVRMTGGTPVFVDIDPATFCITGSAVEAAITDRTVGVMPVHLYGHPAPMDEITDVSRRHSILVFEDAAQAHGAEWRRKRVGGFGTFAAFSFYPTKNMTTGEGGMITTDDPTIADRARLLRNQGMRARYQHEIVGINERMTEIEAAIGLVQLSKLPEWTERRIANAAYLSQNLDDALGPPATASEAKHVFHQFTLRPGDRARVMAALDAAEIGHGIYYPVPTHRQAQFANAGVDLPETDAAAASVISVPVRPDLDEAELETIIATLNGAIS